MRMRATVALAACFLVSAGATLANKAKTTPDAALSAVIAGEWRPAEHKARDPYRNPEEALQFWGLKPGMTILEVQPGAASWWTEILAPYAKRTGGTFYATGADLDDPKLSPQAREARAEFEKHYAARPEVYGKVNVVNWGANAAPLPASTFDFILTARSIHGWMARDMLDRTLKNFHGALKPGGILAVEQHRAKPGPQDPRAPLGYVTEEYVIEAAKKAGFVLEGRSEANANPKDTKDHPFGVWTLPPTRQSAERGQPEDPKFDHSKYDAIGESDRMTLKFRKPA
jgi:predicted methyltransferase